MARGGDRFAPRAAGRPDRFGKPDRFDSGAPPSRGIYPRKGKGYGIAGEAAYPDLLASEDRNSKYQAWRLGMGLAYNSLIADRRQFLPVQVLDRPAWAPQEGWTYQDTLLVSFPSKASPEGRWTVAVKPKGTDVAPLPVEEGRQRVRRISADDGTSMRLLEVDVHRTWGTSSLQAASGLIGELVEDGAVSATRVDDDDEATLMLCVGVYADWGLMYFDGSQYWRRRTLANGRRVLRRFTVSEEEELPRFRAGRHLCQSTTLSCNCPQYLGLEYARLRPGQPLGSQGLFPARAPESGNVNRIPLNRAEEIMAGYQDPQRLPDVMEGVARRFFSLSWQRLPEVACKHVHAVRFALGCPIEEPGDFITLASDYWDDVSRMASVEELRAPLASPRFVQALRSTLLNEDAYAGLSSTLVAGSTGDAFGIVPGRLVLDPHQVSPILIQDADSPFRRFNNQQATIAPSAAEASVLGDLWLGRGTEINNHVFTGPGEILPEPFIANGAAVPSVLP